MSFEGFDFWQNSGLEMSKVSKKSKFRSAQMVKMAIFGLQNDQNWFHVKSKWQKNPVICVFPIRLPRFVLLGKSFTV